MWPVAMVLLDERPFPWLYRQGERLCAALLDGETGRRLHIRYMEETGCEVSYTGFSYDLREFRRIMQLPPAQRNTKAVAPPPELTVDPTPPKLPAAVSQAGAPMPKYVRPHYHQVGGEWRCVLPR